NIPAAVANLDAVQRGSNLIAHFSAPTLTTEGNAIRGALDFDLRIGPPPDPWDQAKWESTARRVPPASVENGIATYSIPAGAFVGKDVVIAARATSENGKSSLWSKPLPLPVVTPPAQPANVQTAADPKGIRITWQAAGQHFRVLRREGDDPTFQ